jgi:hypothetical protein
MPFEPRTLEPIVDPTQALELARDLVVIPNRSVELVPNIGVIGGDHAVLVVETVLAAAFGAMALRVARRFGMLQDPDARRCSGRL